MSFTKELESRPDNKVRHLFPNALLFINIAKWQDTPAPERDWTIKGRIPLSAVTLCAGEGGIGKTLLMLHCGAAIALGRDWLGAAPEPGPVLELFCEDDEHELHRRLDNIVEHYGETHTELAKNFKATSRVGEDAVMAAPDRNEGSFCKLMRVTMFVPFAMLCTRILITRQGKVIRNGATRCAAPKIPASIKNPLSANFYL